jgi:hypothetical protein
MLELWIKCYSWQFQICPMWAIDQFLIWLIYNLWPGSKSGPCWRLAYYSEKVVGPLAWPYLYIPTPLLLANQIDRFISGTSTGLWHSCNGWDPRRCMANFGPTRRVAWSWVGRTNNTTAWRNSTQQCKS